MKRQIALPDMTGDTFADIVVWRWERSRMRWVSDLRDGTKLVVALQRFGRRSFWNPSMGSVALPDNGFRDPESAQKAALAAWKRAKGAVPGFYAPEEDT